MSISEDQVAEPRERIGSTDFITPSVVERLRAMPRLDLIVVAVAGLLPVFWLPQFLAASTPRHALAWILGPVGFWLIVRNAVARGDRASIAALAAAAVAVLAGLFAVEPRAAFVGQLPEWNVVSAYLIALSWWGVGRQLDVESRDPLLWVFTAGALLNGAIGVAQLFEAPTGELFFSPGRASGLMFNPVHYGTFMVGIGVVWAAVAAEQRRSWRPAAISGVLVFFAALSGGRVVLGALVLGWVICGLVKRRAVLRPILAGAIGVVAAEAFMRVVSSANSSVERFGAVGTSGRIDAWRAAVRAVSDRPLLGWGPANSELAVMRNLDLAAAQRQASTGNVDVWWDPHNALLLVLLSSGIIGVVALGVFVTYAARGDRYMPFLTGAVVVVATWMFQPVTVHTLPIVAVLFGAAVRPKADFERGSTVVERPDSRIAAGLMGIGVAVALLILAGAFMIDRAASRAEPDQAASVARWFGGDPWLEMYVATLYQQRYAERQTDESLLAQTVDHARRATELYPTAQNLISLADVSVDVGDVDGARLALERAVELEAWNALAHYRLLLVARFQEDETRADEAKDALCQIGGVWCDLAQPDAVAPGAELEVVD